MALKFTLVGVAVLLSACGTPASSDNAAASAPASGLKVTDAWAQPVTAARTSAAVYLTITTNCPADDVLESAEAQSPEKASLHASANVDNALSMTPLKSVPVACGKPNLLKPMGMHIMVTGIGKPVGIGDAIPLTLHFKRAGVVPVRAEITSMAVLEDVDPMHMHGKHGSSGKMNMDHMDMH